MGEGIVKRERLTLGNDLALDCSEVEQADDKGDAEALEESTDGAEAKHLHE